MREWVCEWVLEYLSGSAWVHWSEWVHESPSESEREREYECVCVYESLDEKSGEGEMRRYVTPGGWRGAHGGGWSGRSGSVSRCMSVCELMSG